VLRCPCALAASFHAGRSKEIDNLFFVHSYAFTRIDIDMQAASAHVCHYIRANHFRTGLTMNYLPAAAAIGLAVATITVPAAAQDRAGPVTCRSNAYTAPGCAIWKQLNDQMEAQLARDRAQNAAADEKWKRDKAAQAAADKKSADESMARYEAEQKAMEHPAPGDGLWYMAGGPTGCTDVTFLFKRPVSTPMDRGAYLKSTGALSFDRTTYDAASHVATYTMVTVAGKVTQYFGTLAACRAAG
jgi:hypothetical protein